jgi:hypothetical protein
MDRKLLGTQFVHQDFNPEEVPTATVCLVFSNMQNSEDLQNAGTSSVVNIDLELFSSARKIAQDLRKLADLIEEQEVGA